MRRRNTWLRLAALFLCAISAQFGLRTPLRVTAQSKTDLPVLQGLAPVAALLYTDAGKAALDANFKVTGGIQTGAIHQPTLLPFAEQQQQALRDAYITGGNLAQLADGLGTTLGAAYVAHAHYIDRQGNFTSISPAVAAVIAYADATSSAHSNAGKFFFANETIGGTKPVSPEAKAILTTIDGTPDIFGKAYGLPASPQADPYGDARPFQTEPSLTRIVGLDYFNTSTDNIAYARGPLMNLVQSPSFPSGHTTYGYTGAVLLAVLVPERYSQMMARGAEYGNDRIIVGAHYAMDVLGGRALALYDMAHLLANDADYMGQPFKKAPVINDFRGAVKKARAALADALSAACGKPVAICAGEDIGRFSNDSANEAFYDATQTYGLPVVWPKDTAPEDVARHAPEAGYLLTVAFPSLSLRQADQILTETEGPGAGFLDDPADGSSFGVYSRLNIYAASVRAAQLAAKRPANPPHSN